MTRRSSSCRAQSWCVLVLTALLAAHRAQCLYLGSLAAAPGTTGRALLPATLTEGWSAQEAKREARQSKHVVDVRVLQKSWAPSPHRAVNDENAPNNGERLPEADLSKVARVLKRHGVPPPPPPTLPTPPLPCATPPPQPNSLVRFRHVAARSRKASVACVSGLTARRWGGCV